MGEPKELKIRRQAAEMAAESERRERAAKARIADERWRREQQKKAPVRLHPATAAPASTHGRGAKLPGGSARRPPRGMRFPDAPTDRRLDYAKRRAEIGRLQPGHIVRILMETRAWREIMAPILAQIEEKRREAKAKENGRNGEREKDRRGQKHKWTAEQLEMIELLRRVLGLRSCKEALAWLSSHEARLTRKVLGLDWAEPHKGGRRRKDGEESEKLASIPCEGTMSTWRNKWFPEKLRAAIWTLLCEELLKELLETVPEKQDELDVVYLDGSNLLIHGTAPKIGKSGRVNNPNSITAPEAGYRKDKGSGWNIDFITTAKGTVVGFEIFGLHEDEREGARSLVDRLREIFKLAGPPKLRILCADAGFNSQDLREELHEIGVLENIHLSSHGNNATAHASVAKRDGMRFAIDRHPNWTVDGHRHLHCACGGGKTSRYAALGKGGRVIAKLKGECATCGPISIISGKWRKAKNPDRFVELDKGETGADWTFGNPLTFHDERAEAYGQPRFNCQEGFFGSQMTQRFQLLKGKRWFYRRSQVELEVAMVIAITHALTLHYHRQRGTAIGAVGGHPPSGASGGHSPPATAPPPLPLAA